MNWTSTQNTGWMEQCDGFAAQRLPFRLDHVAGALEKGYCDSFCLRYKYRQRGIGSSVIFTPSPE